MGPRLNEQVCFALYSTSGTITRAYQRLLAPHRLTYPQFVVMMSLWHHDGATQKAIAESIGITKGTLSPILKNLEMNGYITRNSPPGNDRIKSVFLTTAGKTLAEQGERIAEQALCATGLTLTEANDVIRLCTKIKDHLG
ncbi:Organic hydroperoxide resistance transcriptional regulator [Methylophaga frappieri]|uniref:Organic hydroperoxide resistance transcriptional regulator n=1 Tax=Methylophaga frappieri (strain ATCC BAA-2434 / DSM 25690 / JAM7) TaxID=754477 RepID=I1YJS7_METFJ|nr:MarR family winged helix-turn-helix transcriptional regulator [Methylophaga frappieri]AFJ03170.1 Organic hydroperoxide resistance transcriptional regulator [Methylophaga frappieri]